MASTSDVFLAVSSQAPEQAGKRLSMLTPVIEADDEPEGGENFSEGKHIEHPEFNINDDEQLFLTEDKQRANYVGTKRTVSEDLEVDEVDGLNVSERQNSDGENFDEIYSDSSDGEPEQELKDEDYETDLEYDEESK